MKSKPHRKILITFVGYMLIAKMQVAYAWDDCPKNKVNDPYPGDCARYIDTDNNGICDHSEPAPEDRVTENANETIEETDEKIKVDTKTENVSENQLALNTTKNTIPAKEDDSFWSKSLIAGILVLAQLVGILLYTSYKKVSLKKR